MYRTSTSDKIIDQSCYNVLTLWAMKHIIFERRRPEKMPTRAHPSSGLQTLISSIDSGPFALPLLRSISRFDPGTIKTSSTSVLFRSNFYIAIAMSSNGKSTLFGDSRSEKPKGVEADSFPKPTGTPYVSFGFLIGDLHSKKAKGEASVSSGLTKPSGKTGVSSGVSIGVPNSKNPSYNTNALMKATLIFLCRYEDRGKAAVSSGAKGKAIVSAKAGEVMSFKDVKFGPHEGELRFRLIHFWEARNVVTKVLIGLEMLLIDQEETVIQGFIPAGRIDTYLPHMKAGGIYRLNSFFGSNNKTLYWCTITFSSTSVLSDLEDSSVCFPEDHFQFHGYEEFDAACDLRGDLYDYVGHIKLVNGQVLNDSLVLDDADIARAR
ncbi:hypothetical protein HID58_060056 [Brassica napus]|uniref:Uncharacterized protein n=1 Tax=Brassica napus TaxID=3708 RepID=A0ABQ7ZVP1_BRANA|nr:hypothetical protein HID58_060056 [Brassica napus]